MSMVLMAQAMRTKVGHSGKKMVLIKLADNANDDGVCWPSYQNIADHCEMGRTTVIGHIKKLEEDGFIKKMHRNGAKSSNRYLVCLGEKLSNSTGTDSEPFNSCTSADSEPVTGADSEPRTYHSSEPITNKKTKAKKAKRSKPKFEPPTLEQVEDYARQRGRPDLANKFFDYYDEGKWIDGKGNRVRNWKQKFITWENSNPIQQQGMSHGNSQQSSSIGRNESESQRRARQMREANKARRSDLDH